MGKLVPLLFAGAGTVTVSVGGFYLVKNALAEKDVQLEFEDLNSFIAQPTKSKCVKDYFGSLENANQAREISTTDKPNSNEFFSTSSVEDSSIKSCLKIEYKKTTYKENKWTGKFTGLWAFVRGDEGFINFNVAEPATENKKLKFTGVFYLVKKRESSENTWEIKYKKSISGDKKTDKDQLDTYFPKPYSTLPNAAQTYGGFLNTKGDLEGICSGDGCNPGSGAALSSIKKEFSGTKGNDQTKLLKDWAENLTWGTTLYTNSDWALETKISSYKGNWTEAQ